MVVPRGMNIKSAAEYIGANVWFMRSLIWNRRIPFLKLGSRYVFDRQDLDAFITSQKVEVAQ